jgi:DNA-3-methyladenine glycosylase
VLSLFDFPFQINIIWVDMPGNKLTRSFYEQATLDVAKGLLGKYLVHHVSGTTLMGKIVETEAYVGSDDRASHASRGRTKRTEIMFGPAGYAYVYLIYGMYHCLNVVTEQEGFPAAVLIRALEPVTEHRSAGEETTLANGPGKLCRYMKIDRQLNGISLCGAKLFIEDRREPVAPQQIVAAKRIGVEYAGVWKEKPWRFFIGGHPCISKVR